MSLFNYVLMALPILFFGIFAGFVFAGILNSARSEGDDDTARIAFFEINRAGLIYSDEKKAWAVADVAGSVVAVSASARDAIDRAIEKKMGAK